MTKQELKQVKDFYEQVIMQQIIKPVEIQPIYALVAPHENPMAPYYKKMRAITLFVQALQKDVLDGLEELFDEVEPIADVDNPMSKHYVDKTETAAPEPIPAKADQSHSEDKRALDATLDPPEDIITVLGKLRDKPEVELPEKRELDLDEEAEKAAVRVEIKELMSRHADADANQKRSITMKVKALKKKL